MESEARNQINNNYNEFFYATMCHVCKRFGDGVQLKSCRGCKMIVYCGKEHRKQHWKQHKPLCKAIQHELLRDNNMDYHGETMEEYYNKKMMFMDLVSSRLGRPLHKNERDMFYFPRECLVCHQRNIKSLESCQKCAASFCKNHKDGIEHRDLCAPLELCLYTNLFFMREENEDIPDIILQNTSCTRGFQNMTDFIKANWNIQPHSEMLYKVMEADLSRYLTNPLTLFYAMRLLNVPKNKDLVIHIVGANQVDVFLNWTWQVLLPLMETVISVVVIMIGPGLKDPKFDPSRTDDLLVLGNESFSFEYHNVSYEKYVRSPSFIKPNMIFGFSVSIEEHTDLNKEIWAPSIHALAKQNCPFVLAFSLEQSLQEGMNKINTILGKEVDYLYSGKNPFACCGPRRGCVNGVNYLNQYVVIYQSLCS